MQITSKLNSKNQITVPQKVQKRLNLKAGDYVLYSLNREGALLKKAKTPVFKGDPFGAFEEWRSKADNTAYETL